MRIPIYGNETREQIITRLVKVIEPMIGKRGIYKLKEEYSGATIQEIMDMAEARFGITFYDDLASLKRKAKLAIELAAVQMDHRVFDTGGNATVIYEEKKAEITAWDAAGRPQDITDYKYMRIEQRRLEILTGGAITPLQAAASIKQTVDKWDNDISYYREFYRLVGKAKIEVATSYNDVISLRDQYVTSLNGLA